ncbi:MAG TPA: hypothetical protein VFJ90_12410 [Candidatus Didemnitutus sp.]|nr:hypothetical protein [Candidatus Didemnitutus sp.]
MVTLRRLLLAFVAVLLVTAGPAGAQQRNNPRNLRQFRTATTFVTITVPATAYNTSTGVAVVTIPRAVLGQLYAAGPWTLTARADRANFSGPPDAEPKSTSDLAIRASGDPAYQPLSTAPVRVLNGTKTAGWINVAFDLQFTTRLTDASGSHNFRVLFDFN